MRRRLGFAVAAVLVALVALGSADAGAAARKRKPAPLPRATIAARIHLLGAKNVNARTGAVKKDRVVFSWYGTANFVAAIKGHVVLFDGFLRRAYNLRQVHTTLEELAATRPEYIFLGHAHFDHAIDAGQLSILSRAPIVGLPTHCTQVKQWVELQGSDPSKVRCITAMSQKAPLGTIQHRPDLLRGVPITIVRHLHTPYTALDKGAGQTSVAEPGGPEYPCPHEPQWEGFPQFPGTAQEVKNVFLNAVGVATLLVPNSDGGVILYQFRVGRLNITFNDSQGALDYHPEVVKALKSLPPTDIEIGSIAANVQHNSNCLHDVRRYWEVLHPKVFVPIHHDAQDPSQEPAAYWKPFLAEELGRMPAASRPCIDMIEDPENYLDPGALTFRTNLKPSCNPQLELRSVPPQGIPHPSYGPPG